MQETGEPPPAVPSRRRLLGYGLTGVTLAALGGKPIGGAQDERPRRAVEKGRVRQSVCRWCYSRIPLAELAAAAAEMGLLSVEILRSDELDAVSQHGLGCAMVSTHGITQGLNDPQHHESCLEKIREGIDAAAARGFPNVITFSGNRNGMPDDVGLENCVKALERIVGYAEKRRVTICLEMLNSKVNHPDYMADNTPFGVELCRRVGSERFRLLYDIYHMQIMEGDVIRTIREHHDCIAHYHTAGNPGRHELDESQELFYPAIMRAILDTGYTGFVGQEFIPTGEDPLASLAHGVRVCDV